MRRSLVSSASVALVLGALGVSAAHADTAPASILVADSATEFSATQGSNNWYYGSTSGDISSFTSAGFTQFGFFYKDAWHAVSAQEYPYSWAQLWSSGGHPNGSNTNNNPQTAVRRWVSEVDGAVTLTGTFQSTGGGGVIGGIFVDGKNVWSSTAASSGAPNYSFSAVVGLGSKVDFVIDPNGGDYSDSTKFTALITTPVPEPKTYAMMMIGLGLIGGIARRKKQQQASA